MPFLHTKSGLEIYYEEKGEGNSVLFLMGSDGDLQKNPVVSPFRTSLVKNFRVLAYDERGLGASRGPDCDYTMEDYANDAGEVLDALGCSRVELIGYSFGGMVAQEFALRSPDRVGKLVLLNSSSGGAGGSSFPIHTLAGLDRGELHRRRLELWDTRRDRVWQKKHPGIVEAWIREWDELEEGIRPGSCEYRDRAHQLAARKQHNTYDRLSKLHLPVLLVTGKYDGIAPRARQEAMQSQISKSEVLVFEGGHRVLWEDPEAAKAISAFFDL